MPRLKLALCVTTLVLLSSSTLAAVECSAPRTYEKARKKCGSTTLLVQPFRGPKSVASVVTVLVKGYLSLAKGICLLPIGSNAANEVVLTGEILREGQEYLMKTTLGGDLLRTEARFRFPQTLNDALVDLALRVSKALNHPLSEKKLLPYLNTTRSEKAYQHYAAGMLTLDKQSGTLQAPLLASAQSSFEQAIREDYNYVPAYLGLAETLAARSALEGTNGKRATVELEKARLLHPPSAKRRESRIQWYLKAKTKDLCGEGK